MKALKRIFLLLFTAILLLGNVFPLAAAVEPQITASAGSTVTVSFTYQQVAGVQGTFEFSDKSLFSKISISATGGLLVESINKTGKVMCGGVELTTITLELKLTVASTAKVGDQCKITYSYEKYYVSDRHDTLMQDTVTILVTEVGAVDFEQLRILVEYALSLNQNKYTMESWTSFRKALTFAKMVLQADIRQDVNKAYDQLQQAIDGLQTVADYSRLQAIITFAKSLKQTEYTADSWLRLEQALQQAEAALDSIVQSEIDAATDTLTQAIGALVKKSDAQQVDYSELLNQINMARSLDPNDYTSASWKALQTTLEKALEALDSTDQATVDAAAKALKKAISELKTVYNVDYTALQQQIQIAQSLVEWDYTATSWSVLQSALNIARQATSSSIQSEVDAAATSLKEAIESLVKMDFTTLDSYITAAQGLQQKEYTSTSWSMLQHALTAALIARETGDQATVAAAAETLRGAIEGLVKMDYTKLNKQIKKAEQLNRKDYTADSWEAMQKALQMAIQARNSNDQAVVDAAAKALKNAMEELVPASAFPWWIVAIVVTVLIAALIAAFWLFNGKKSKH